tara:strand:+ start:305 stop:505 length:201 start_codon:yes stop_codon:yes gene_type:complete
LTDGEGYCRINLERNIMDKDKYQTITDGLYIQQGSLNRIADALEEVLRLVKKDQEETKKRWEKESE